MTVQGQDSDMSNKKVGRPKTKKEGDPATPRQVSYIVIGNKLDDANSSTIKVDEEFKTPQGISEEELQKYTIQYVTKLFSDRGWTGIKIYGPKYDVKGLFKQLKIQSVPPADTDEFGNSLGLGEFEGWQGHVFEIKNRPDVYGFVASKNITGKNSSRKVGGMEIVPVYAVKLNNP